MSNRPVPGITTLSVNGKSNRKWEPTVVQQGFIACHENVSSSVQMPRKHAYEKDKDTVPFTSSTLFRVLIFVVLTLQATCYFSLLRYSRTRSNKMYFTSTAVFLAEVVKLFTTLVVIFFQCGNVKAFTSYLIDNLFVDHKATFRLSVPSLLYVVQNNLVYIAMTHLESTTFQITNQLKILTTAVFSILLLNKQLTKIKWISLVLLAIGVTMVQIDTHTSVEAEMSTTSSVKSQQSAFLGFTSVLAASMVSGFAGVYMEKIFKTGKRKLFWISNAQLYTFGIILSFLGVAYQDGVEIARMGFFHGYDIIVCLVILFASAGGIIVSLILKYASCITKGFATSCAIVLSSLVSVYVFYFIPGVLFILGAVSVIVSVLLYSC
ncbi:CMP-sialic acid transporter-like [Pocillopora damicornis]|uniref:CMP-sialic acid transporter-like n=1 Tax=Pocillopora damicornis TaxID=46731 RepID=UPI000F54F519|nr:CMP-sialic acid transporter-like [Pocillopora damicornis]